MDLSKLTKGQKFALAAGLVLIINLFLPWYRVDFGIGSVSANAFDSPPAGFLAWGGSLIAVVGAAILAVEAFSDTKVEIGALKGSQVALVLGGLGTLLVLLQFITETSNVFIGVFLGILAAAGVTYGSFTVMKESGVGLPTADDFKSIAGGGKGDDPGDSPGPDAGR